jgi:hypothetical protein
MVAWKSVTQPIVLGGLGILDLTTLGYALRLWWECLARVEPSHIWVGLTTKPEKVEHAMFEVSTTVTVGSGTCTLFWEDHWFDDMSIGQLAPEVYQAVRKRVRQTRLVSEAIPDGCWIADIVGSLSMMALGQYLLLWDRLQGMQLDGNTPNKFIWKWLLDQQYLVSSAYHAFFKGRCGIHGAKELSKTKAPPNCNFFVDNPPGTPLDFG